MTTLEERCRAWMSENGVCTALNIGRVQTNLARFVRTEARRPCRCAHVLGQHAEDGTCTVTTHFSLPGPIEADMACPCRSFTDATTNATPDDEENTDAQA